MATDPSLRTRGLRRVEYDTLVDLGVFAGERIELLDGVLVVREPQGSSHAAVAARVGQVLAACFGPAWHVRLHSPLALGEESEPEPDVAVVSGAPLDYLAAHPSTAALVVEIADSSVRIDRRGKASEYARAGLPDYWIVNLADSMVEVHRDPEAITGSPHGAGYRAIEILRPPAAIAPLALPDRPVLVADLLP